MNSNQINITAKINSAQLQELHTVCEKNHLLRNALIETVINKVIDSEIKLPKMEETIFSHWPYIEQVSILIEKDTKEKMDWFCKINDVKRNIFIWYVIEKAKQVSLNYPKGL